MSLISTINESLTQRLVDVLKTAKFRRVLLRENPRSEAFHLQTQLCLRQWQPVCLSVSIHKEAICYVTDLSSPNKIHNFTSGFVLVWNMVSTPTPLGDLKVYHRAHKSPPPVHIPSQINAIWTFNVIFVRSVLILSTNLSLSIQSGLFSSGFLTKNSVRIYHLRHSRYMLSQVRHFDFLSFWWYPSNRADI